MSQSTSTSKRRTLAAQLEELKKELSYRDYTIASLKSEVQRISQVAEREGLQARALQAVSRTEVQAYQGESRMLFAALNELVRYRSDAAFAYVTEMLDRRYKVDARK